jgi:signal transduction histidine kinase
VLEVIKSITGMEDNAIESSIMGRALTEVFPIIKNYDDRAFLEQLNRTKSTICHEKKEININGSKAYYNMTYHPILNVKGDISELLVAGIDVTSEVEKGRQMEDILKLKDEFLYLMSHEFKTPLTVINAAVQSLEYIYSSQIPDKALALVEKIKQNTFRQIRLVNNLLDITRINAGQLKINERNIDIVFLARAITESVAIYAEQKEIEVIFTSKLKQRVLGIDDEKFERILLNLLSNAIKFTPAGKKVVVELSAVLKKNKQMVCIKVKDQGIGIPKEKYNLIFERFGQVNSTLTRQAEGSGIGLFLVKLMVNSCKWEISLESEEGKGSIFTLMIPSNKVKVDTGELEINQVSDSKLVQSMVIEFSDIYF